MRIVELHLIDFRGYHDASLRPAEGVNLVTGPNGTGKTNLLEAAAVVSAGRSPRIRAGENLVRRGEARSRLRARFRDGRGDEHEVVVLLEAAGGRRVRVDGKPARRLSELLGRFPTVQLFPEDLELATGAPARRRAWLDTLSAWVVPGYLKLRQEFERSLRQRNAALKARRSAGELDSHTAPFLRRAREVHRARALAMTRLQEEVAHLEDLFEAERPTLEYWAAGLDGEGIGRRLEARLGATASAERRLLATQVGPHRDDFRLRIGGVEVQENASRGQLRTLLLQLKLAEAALVAGGSDEAPLLILDDALSDMDRDRRRRTLRHLSGRGQVILSVPEAPGDPGSSGTVFSVASGTPKMVV